MKKIILATLTSGFLLSGTVIAFAECQSFAQARASNPNTYLAYHVVAGAHCWYAGHPSFHRDLPVVQKRRPQSMASSNEDRRAGPHQAPITFQKMRELNTPGALSERLLYGTRIADGFDEIAPDTSSVQEPDTSPVKEPDTSSVQESESKSLAFRAPDSEDGGIQPAQPRQRGPPVGSAAHYIKFVIWVLLTIGVGTLAAGILDLYGERSHAALQRFIANLAHSLPRLGVRDYAEYSKAHRALLDFIADWEASGLSRGPTRNDRHRGSRTLRRISRWLRGTDGWFFAKYRHRYNDEWRNRNSQSMRQARP